MYRGSQSVRRARSSDVPGDAASAWYSPSRCPTTTLPAAMVAPRSVTNRPSISFTLASSIAMSNPFSVVGASGLRGAAATRYRGKPLRRRMKAVRRSPRSHTGAARSVQAAHEVADVDLGGLLADAEGATDLAIGVARRDQRRDLD